MKKLICVIFILAVMFSFVACGKDKTVSNSGGQPETSVDSQPNSGGEASKDVEEQKLNVNLLSNIGMTYAQLKEKYGKPTKVITYESSLFHVFENGYGNYRFDYDVFENRTTWPTSEEFENFEANGLMPKEGSECLFILGVNADILFLGLAVPTSVSDIEKIYGLEHKSTRLDNGHYGGSYVSNFLFEDKVFSVISSQEGVIEPDCYINIFPEDFAFLE